MVRGASSRLGHLTKRAGARATVSSAQTDPLSRAAFKFMADTAKASTEERHRVDTKLEDQRQSVDDRFQRILERFSSSQNSLRTDFSSLRTDFSSMRTDVHAVDKKVTYISGGTGLLVVLVTLAGVANSFQHYLQMLVFYRDMGNGMEHHLKPAGVVADWKSGGINKGAGERRCRTPAAWPGLSAHIPRA
ncbi:hypothetical protein Ndes2526B_g08513 [Nannochloris sp. 'desiccata']|nr:hypothetical protein NADE_001238 [Chlorella desiccata (nom. nud.)]